MTGVLIYLKFWNKVRMGIILREMLKYDTAKVRLGSSIIQKPKIRYSWDLNLFKMLK